MLALWSLHILEAEAETISVRSVISAEPLVASVHALLEHALPLSSRPWPLPCSLIDAVTQLATSAPQYKTITQVANIRTGGVGAKGDHVDHRTLAAGLPLTNSSTTLRSGILFAYRRSAHRGCRNHISHPLPLSSIKGWIAGGSSLCGALDPDPVVSLLCQPR